MYFNPKKLLDGFMYHVGFEELGEVGEEFRAEVMKAAIAWQDNGKLVKLKPPKTLRKIVMCSIAQVIFLWIFSIMTELFLWIFLIIARLFVWIISFLYLCSVKTNSANVLRTNHRSVS